MNWYKSREFPEHLYTRSQLRKMKLKPSPNQKPSGYWHRQCYHADIELWDAREAIPLRKCSTAQLEALAKARAKIGEAERIEQRLLMQGDIREEYSGCLIEIRSELSDWLLLIHLPNEAIWQWSQHCQWHEVCLKIGRAFIDNLGKVELDKNTIDMEGSHFFRNFNEEKKKRQEHLKKLPGHCPNCGESIAILMLNCPYCEKAYPP